MWKLAAGVTGIALIVSGCGSSTTGGTAAKTAGSTEKITLTVATFNEFGYEGLLAEYTKLHPNITVTQKKAATSNEARDNMNTRLAAGSGLSDVEAIEVDWLPELMQYPKKFVDLKDKSVDGRWLDWKVAQATTKDGVLLGYGTDIGPEASATAPTCSRRPACRPTVPRSPSSSAAPTPPGTTTSPRARSSRQPTPRPPGWTRPAPPTRA